jgi:flagellar basal-body rod protein FlgG
MKVGWWITAACGLTLGACLGYMAGNIAASATEPLSFQRSTAVLPTAPELLAVTPGAGQSADAHDADDGVVFFPEGSIAGFPSSSTEMLHAAGEIEAAAGDDAAFVASEPAELPESSDAAPLGEAWDELTLRRIVEHELADVPEADQEVWVDALRGLPREDVVGILRLWRKFGGGPASMLPVTPDFGTGRDILHGGPGSEETGIPSPLVPEPPETGMDSALAALFAARRIIINNLLNAETIGYRRREVLFSEPEPGNDGAALLGTRLDHSQGRLVDTANILDVGIEGPGFFVVSDGDQQYFTRCGRFSRGEEGRLVLETSRGALVVQPEILIPEEAPWPLVNLTAEQAAGFDHEPSETVLQSVRLALFADPGRLESVGDALFVATPASGTPQIGAPAELGTTALRPMCLERSNVAVGRERRLLTQIDCWLDLARSLPLE